MRRREIDTVEKVCVYKCISVCIYISVCVCVHEQRHATQMREEVELVRRDVEQVCVYVCVNVYR